MEWSNEESGRRRRWPGLLAASLIPFGNFYVDRTILKKMDA